MWRSTWLVLTFGSLALACNTLPSANDCPAILTDVSDASRAALQAAVNEIAGGDVTLSNNALTDRSVLIIEKLPTLTMQNPAPQGRIMEPPIKLQLVINRTDCILVDTRDQSRHRLDNTRCTPE